MDKNTDSLLCVCEFFEMFPVKAYLFRKLREAKKRSQHPRIWEMCRDDVKRNYPLTHRPSPGCYQELGVCRFVFKSNTTPADFAD